MATSKPTTADNVAKGGKLTPKKQPIVSDLFRFATLRTPQLISSSKKSIGFITHPEVTKSHFLKEVTVKTAVDTARDAVAAKLKTYTNAKTRYTEVKDIDRRVYEFSNWLIANRSMVLRADVTARVKDIVPLNEANLLMVWDNLHYQLLTKKSDNIRQACIQMLIAHNFLSLHAKYDAKVHEGKEDDYLTRLANAKVLIDRAFTSKVSLANNTVAQYSRLNNEVEARIQQHIAQERVQALEGSITTLKGLEAQYQKAYQTAYDAARKAHAAEVAKRMAEEQKDYRAIQQKEADLSRIDFRLTDDVTWRFTTPTFNFTFESPFNTAYLKTAATEAKTLINEHQLTDAASITRAISTVENQIKATQTAFVVPQKEKTVVVNGIVIPTTVAQQIKPNCFLVNTRFSRDNFASNKAQFFNGAVKSKVYFTINLGNAAVQIASQEHTLKFGSTEIKSTAAAILNNANTGLVTLELFSDKSFVIGQANYTLSGTLTLTDGKELSYSINVISIKKVNQGCCKLKTDATTGGNTNDNAQPAATGELFGIGKVGVADFRKVEQEVCCYVPGQVSHIENILAREYKERATRNLQRHEVTNETSKEKEAEQLTDTTTTERNEMHSEVSTVMTEDQSQSFGASTGVSGTYGSGPSGSISFNANAYADFNSATSNSVSNNNAQTYAKDVTERALDRIVQRSSKKRTSRMLREFEETNKHGFDNRKGDQHVSGVYRWIDIIYKNRVVNYGKRLMYEFMVPEPARFYKEAIITKGNNDANNAIVLEKPLHPSELSGGIAIHDAKGLSQYNYQQLASYYGVSVKPFPEGEKIIGWDYAFGTPNQWGVYQKSTQLELPEGYESSKWSFRLTGKIHDGGANWGISIGNDFHRGGFEIEGHNNRSISGFTGKLPIAVYFDRYWGGSFTVEVQVKRTNTYLEHWQNETYKNILEAYNERLQAYKESLAAAGVGQTDATKKIRQNPLFNRTLEKRELKRICIEMLTQPYNNPFGQDNYKPTAQDAAPEVKQDANFERHASHVKFFEQAFDWEIMAYLFYPYYWANQQNWKQLFQQTDAADPIFQAFLQSGMARTVIPVRPGFEEAVNYYMETGEIWNGGDLVLDDANDLYVSIAEEMMPTTPISVGTPWITRVPTALTMIQKDTIGLDEQGLPCCKEVTLGTNGEVIFNPIKHENKVFIGGSTTAERTATTTGKPKPVIPKPITPTNPSAGSTQTKPTEEGQSKTPPANS